MSPKEPRRWPVEWREYDDPVSGAHVRQLTDYFAHSHHLYFTNPGWYDGGKKLLFGSDRENVTNLFGIDLETGEIEQLTDFGRPRRLSFQRTCVNPKRDEAYFLVDRELRALDLRTLEMRAIGKLPDGFVASILNCTADGRHVCTSCYEDLSRRFRMDLGRGYVGFRENFEAHPLTRIVRYAVDGSGEKVLHEEKCWISHVNTSPTKSNLLMFCHEGPWDLVDNRIWCLDVDKGEVWKVRPREAERERIGHEYWFADGLTVGYHGARPDGRYLLGHIRYDNADKVEVDLPGVTGHTHSNDGLLIVGDGGSVVRIWKWNGSGYDGPRVLCLHRSSCHTQKAHVHPRFTPEGSQVVFTSDTSGYGNVYLADVPEFESLPEAKD